MSRNNGGKPVADEGTISARNVIKTFGQGPTQMRALDDVSVDIRQGDFGTAAWQTTDFQAAATALKVGAFKKTPVSGWDSVTLNATGLARINRTGVTQFRLYFTKDDNNDKGADFMRFFSGNSPVSRPTLTITYTLP